MKTGDENDTPTPPHPGAPSRGSLPPSWTRGNLGQKRRDRDTTRELLRDKFDQSYNYDKDVDGPLGGNFHEKIDLKTGRMSAPRRPPQQGSGISAGDGISRFNADNEPSDIRPHAENYHSFHTEGDKAYFETTSSSLRHAAEVASFRAGGAGPQRSGIGSGARTNRVGDAKSKVQQYAHRGYDWLERLAKKGPHANDRDLRVNIFVIALVLGMTFVFSYWMLAYRTVVLTTNIHRKEVTRLPKLPCDFVYFQSKWPWSLVTLPWSKHDPSLLVVREMGNVDSRSPSAIAASDTEKVDASVDPLFISSRLYRNPRDCVVQVHPDPVTGRHVEKRVSYNKMFYNAIPYLFERDLPFVVNLSTFADPFLFQRENIGEKNGRGKQLETSDTSSSGLPDSYPATKRPALFDDTNNESRGAAPRILFNFKIRLMRDAPSHNGALPFVEAIFQESSKVIFTKYYYDAIIRHHREKTMPSGANRLEGVENNTLIQRMINSGVINGEEVTFDKVFEGGRAEQFVDEVLNEIVLRVAGSAIIIEKEARLV